jgi:histone-lysine N-methyltransferase SETMAR
LQKSAGKVLASIFWDRDGILLIDYLPKGETINVKYYSSLLVQLKDILKEKRRAAGRSPRGSCSCTRMPRLIKKKLAYLVFHCLNHLPYSPDVAPSDYHLFHGVKKQ